MINQAPAERQSSDLIRHCLLENYGIAAELSRLPGENLNYLAVVQNDEKYVVKIASSDQSESLIEMEFQALQYAARFLRVIKLPQIVENKFGNAETFFSLAGNSPKRLRVIEYLSGTLLENTDISGKCRFEVGKSLAEFDCVMKDFDHPAAHREHRWDLTQAAQHQASIQWLASKQQVNLLSWAFDQYKQINTGISKRIKWQFIHGDANPENILIEADRVVGLLDFGDSCFNPRICELAICLPYLMMDQPDPITAAFPVIEAYNTINPLNAEELTLLWPLLLGRLATTISVATQRRQLDPHHPNWFVSEERAWSLLKQLRVVPNPFL